VCCVIVRWYVADQLACSSGWHARQASDPTTGASRRLIGPHAVGRALAHTSPATAASDHTSAGPKIRRVWPRSRAAMTCPASRRRRGPEPHRDVAVVQAEHRGLAAGWEGHRHAWLQRPALEQRAVLAV